MIFLGALAATVPAGRLTDRVPAGAMLGGTLLVLVAGLLLCAIAQAPAVLFAGLALIGIGYGAAEPPTSVLVSANVSRERRGLLMGIKQTGMTVGGLLGGLILPSVALASSWRVALALPIALSILVALAGFWLRGATPESRKLQTAEAVRPISYAGIASYGFVMAGVQVALLGFLAVFLIDREGLTTRTAGLAVALTLAGATTGRISWGVISDRYFGTRVLALQLAALGSAITLALLSVTGLGPSLWIVLFVLGFCALGWNGVYLAAAAESVAPARVGRATGGVMVFTYSGALLMPVLFGLVVAGTESWPASWLIVAGVVASAVAVFTLTARRVAGHAPPEPVPR